jgi:PTH1 family peptidyl-tRNA hydrolase
LAPHIELIVGLGNPGAKYEPTRHNVGFWFVDRLVQANGAKLRQEAKFHGEVGKLNIGGEPVWLLKPSTFMNNSGQAVAALAQFYKIPPQHILVVHDELDIAPGALRVKEGGGHGGHNGLRDIAARLGSKDFVRLRIGIGHPGTSRDVTNYVLGKPSPDDRDCLDQAIDEALRNLPQIVAGELQKAMNHLHSL